MSARIVYLNGRFLPVEDAYVSVMDRGFLLGDGVYESIPMFNGKFFKLRAHLQRLRSSMAAIHLDLPFEEAMFQDIVEQLIQHNPQQGENRIIYLQVTRGAGEDRQHAFPEKKLRPTIFAQSTSTPTIDFAALSAGSKAITMPDIRWAKCAIKAITLLPNVMMTQQVLAAKATEAILIRNGMAVEGITSNLFIVKNGTLITPPADGSILQGVTRDTLLAIADQHHIPFFEKNIPQQTLKEADEVWLTGSIKEILPITQIDDNLIAEGRVGELWHRFFKYYQQAKLQS
jgi:D-alanine transaminase